MADIVRGFADGEGTTSCTARSVAAGVSRVPDVGGVGGDGGATGAAVDDTAHSKPSCAVSISTSALSRTLRAGVAGPVGGGVDHTAHSKPSSTVTISASALSGALRAGVAGPVGGGGARPCALLVGELDDGEEREGL